MLKKILFLLIAVVAGACAFVATRPSEFRISRSALMEAPAPVVFAEVNDFHNWDDWSPWAKLDPNAKQTYEGAAAGEGATVTWAGNREVGEGKMTIAESRPFERIRIHLEFVKPMKGVSQSEFTFMPDGNGTRVTWTMTGHNNFVGKAMSLVFNCDKMVGGQFEKGLAQLKSVVE